VDVAVIGSGGAGLVAALRAADRDRRVVVIEKSGRIGGTTAVSGGVLWIPCNHHMAELAVGDSREEALTYLRRIAFGQSTEELLEAFVDHSVGLARYLEARTPVRLRAVDRPDYHPELAGGKPSGRSLDNEPFDGTTLGASRELLRTSPHYPPITYRERYEWRRPDLFDWPLIAERIERGVLTLGAALCGALFRACLDRGVEFVLGTRGRALTRRGDRVTGLTATDGEGEIEVEATRAVIMATGGFEWNPAMKIHFLRGPEVAPATPPWNTGDGILMGLAIGAAVGNMNEAAWFPVIRIPGEEYDGQPVSRLIVEERSRPGSIIVNRGGRRFVNEAVSYNDIVRAFHVFDPQAYEHANLPAWLLFDARFKRTYSITTVMPTDPPPSWFKTGATLEELAGVLGVDGAGLRATVDRFNALAARGVDPDFRRGESLHDRFNGDPDHRPNPCLGPLDTPPFFAVELLPGSVSTKGGLLTDAEARVVSVEGRVIRGLYACGNAMASSMGIGYPGAGGMLGPGMTFGYLAGDRAGAERP
jgi:succinate dehydrogenase/fumarate reductase flavoprotein subunit